MRRRHALAACAAALDVAPSARTQPALVRVGYLGGTRPDTPEIRRLLDAFRAEMQRLGWREGSRIAYELRFADGVVERFAPLARELVALKPDLVFAVSASAVDAVKAATSTIPVVFVTPDPIEEGQVASLAHPGANLTGLAILSLDLIGKRMQLLREAFPRIARVAYLGFDHPRVTGLTQAAASALRLELLLREANRAEDLPRALATAARADAWFVGDHLTYHTHRRTIVEAIASQRLPAIYPQIGYVQAGGLMFYGTDLRDLYGRAAVFADRILRGAKPGDLPIEQPTKFELVINLKTARALGFVIPQSVLLRADEVIE